MELDRNLDILRKLEQSVRDNLGERVLIAARPRAQGRAVNMSGEHVILVASTKLVTELGGRECSVHTAVFVDGGYRLVAGNYGLTIDSAFEDFSTRYLTGLAGI